MLQAPNVHWKLNRCLSINSHSPKRTLRSLRITDTGLCSLRRSGRVGTEREWNDKSKGDLRPGK